MGLQEDKERVREASDIVDVVSKIVQLKPSGKNLKGLCPFHQEKTPSFFVDPDRQRYHCFGCQADGDAFEFLMKTEGLDFKQALTTLASQANIALTPTSPSQPQDEAKSKRLRQLADVLSWANERFQSALNHESIGQPAKAYLTKRGLSEQQINLFGLGFAPAGRNNLIKAANRDHYSLELLEEAGLTLKKDNQSEPYDRFRNRLIFPIQDVQGKVIGFGGRVIGQGEPKYLNSPETPIYHKGDHLYGLCFAKEQARKQRQLILVEGYLDTMACTNAGVTNVVGSLGTALTPKQAKLLKRYASEVIILYDTDEAGVQAAIRAFELINQEKVVVKALRLKHAKDPDEYIQKFGSDKFKEALMQAVHFVDYRLDHACEQYDIGTIEGKLKIKDDVVSVIVQLDDRSAQFEYTKRLAERLGQPVQIIDEEVMRANKNLNQRIRKKVIFHQEPLQEEPISKPDKPRPPAPAEEKLLIAMLLRFPTQIELVKEKLNLEIISDPDHLKLIHAIYEMPLVDPDEEEFWTDEFLKNENLEGQLRDYAKMLIEEDKGEEDPWPVILDCIKRLMKVNLRSKEIELQRQIQNTAANGDLETLKNLEKRKFELATKIRELGVFWK